MSLTPFFQPSNQTHTFLSNYRRRLLLLAVLIIASLTWASRLGAGGGTAPTGAAPLPGRRNPARPDCRRLAANYGPA
jgi:hypothetical protein